VAGGSEAEPDAALIAFHRRALDEARLFELADVLRHPRHRDALERGELAHPDPGVVLDLDEQTDLAARHAE
jgi:hypothetical protein